MTGKCENPTCYFCHSSVVTDEHYCPGCGQYICEDCDNETEDPLNKHEPETHLDLEEYDDD